MTVSNAAETAADAAQSPDPDTGPLSLNQEFLTLFDQGPLAGPFGPRYHIVHGWRVRGRLDVEALAGALRDVVERHETLRTELVRDGEAVFQRVLPVPSVSVEVRQLGAGTPTARERAAETLLDEIEAGTHDISALPLVRVVVGRFDDDDAVLALIVHHTATDGWSVRVLIRDLTHCYAVRRGLAEPLPPATRYRDFAVEQRAFVETPAAERARGYWRERLAGASIAAVPTELPRGIDLPAVTAVHRFGIGEDVVAPALELGRAERCSPFMVLFAAFHILLHRHAGTDDTVVPTFSPGRGSGHHDRTVGSFFNFLPIRASVSDTSSFRDVLHSVRASCVAAYSNDIPAMHIFGQAPELMLPVIVEGRAPFVFQVFAFPFLLDGETVGDLEYTELRRRTHDQPVSSDVPDGMLWTLNLDPAGDIMGSAQYRSNVYSLETATALAAEYRAILAAGAADPDRAIGAAS
jgi:hypothetical protein